MDNRSLAVLAILVSMHGLAKSQPTTLHCRYFDNIKKDGSLMAFAEQFVVIDAAEQTVSQNGNVMTSRWSEEEVRAERENLKYGPEPTIVAFSVMVFKRHTGAFASFTQYRTAEGRSLFGKELQQLAEVKGAWNDSFAGIGPSAVLHGKCVVAQPKLF
jgi:hypothetical protein